MYLPGMDDVCPWMFVSELSKRYPDHHLLVVLDGAPSHRSEQFPALLKQLSGYSWRVEAVKAL